MSSLSRRRFITLAASASVLPNAAFAETAVSKWQGIALGAQAEIKITGLTQAQAAPIFAKAMAKIERLEQYFSLSRSDSLINQLNQTGAISTPPPEMLELFSIVTAIHTSTNGAFDPTVNPLWQAIANNDDLETRANAAALIGWQDVHFDSNEIRFKRKGMGITLNGIAQGYIADRVAALMRDEGLTDLIINTGEISALGRKNGLSPWQAGVIGPKNNEILARVELTDRALATSAPRGSTITDTGVSHILDPKGLNHTHIWQVSSVSAKSAAIADGLSTAFIMMTPTQVENAIRLFSTAKLEYLA